jgi:outer membrane protein TolC
MKIRSGILSALLLVFYSHAVVAQQNVLTFSLDEAVQYAMDNNYDVIYSEKNIEAAKQQMREATSFGLPQIDGVVDYGHNLELPVSVIPGGGDFFGQPGEDVVLQFGTKYNMTAGAYLSQLLFSGKYIVGLQTAKVFMEKANVDFFRDKVAVTQQVANSYYDVLSVEEALWVVDTTLSVTRKLAEETRMTYEVGFAEDIDADQLDLLVIDLEASRIYFENQLVISHAFLKFYLGLDDQDSLVLTDGMEDLVADLQASQLLADQFNYRLNPDFVSLSKQKTISLKQIQLEKTEYYPTLMANLNVQTNAQRNEWDFFDPGGAWYASSVLGVTLAVPILSSGERLARVRQAKVAYEQMGILEDQLATQLKLQYDAARNEYMNAYTVYKNKDQARKVANKILGSTRIKFSEGMVSSLDILNTQNQYLSAEQDYINAAIALLKASAELERLLAETVE